MQRRATVSLYEGKCRPLRQAASNITSLKEVRQTIGRKWPRPSSNRTLKLETAVEVVEDMEQRGIEGVPQQLREIIEFALDLAEEARDG